MTQSSFKINYYIHVYNIYIYNIYIYIYIYILIQYIYIYIYVVLKQNTTKELQDQIKHNLLSDITKSVSTTKHEYIK